MAIAPDVSRENSTLPAITTLFHPPRNDSFGNIKTEHEQFAVNPEVHPKWVLGHHLEDQIPSLFRAFELSKSPSSARCDAIGQRFLA